MAAPLRQQIKSFSELGDFFATSAKRLKKKRGFAAAGRPKQQFPEECCSDADVPSMPADCDEENLFRRAVGDVEPLSAKGSKRRRRQKRKKGAKADQDAIAALRNLVATGEGFVVAQTPEYMEGRGYGVSPVLARRLHNGDFSVQGHIDLHGYGVQDASQAVDVFLAESISARRRVVLIIHGRGLSSPGRPVLKEKLRDWLSTGRWRKWVLAFTSARAEDGGAGATYVLLRTRAAGKSERRGCTFVK